MNENHNREDDQNGHDAKHFREPFGIVLGEAVLNQAVHKRIVVGLPADAHLMGLVWLATHCQRLSWKSQMSVKCPQRSKGLPLYVPFV